MSEGINNPVLSLEQIRQMSNSPLAPQVDVNQVNQGQNQDVLSLQDIRRIEEEEDPFGQVQAGLAGLARGATFGLSDLALTRSGLVEPETLRALEEAYPTTSLVSELAPIVATIPFTGGASAAAGAARGAGLATRAAKAATAPIRGVTNLSRNIAGAATQKLAKDGASFTARNAIKKATEAGLGSAIEASFYGAGQFVSDAALGDPEANAEKLLANIGYSAALGGAFGTVFNAAGQGIRQFSKQYKPAVRAAFKKVSLLDDDTIDFVANDKNYARLRQIQEIDGGTDEKVTSFVREVFDTFQQKADDFTTRYGQEADDIARQFRFDGQSVPLKTIQKEIQDGIKNLSKGGTAGRAAQSAIKSLKQYEEQLTDLALQNIKKANLGKQIQDQLKNFKGSKAEQKKFLLRLANRPEIKNELRLTSDQLLGISKAANVEAKARNLYNPFSETKPGAFEWSQIGQAARKSMDNFSGPGGERLRALNRQYGQFREASSKLKRFGLTTGADEIQAIPRLTTLMKGTSKSAKEAQAYLKQLDEVLGTDLSYNQQLVNAFLKINNDKLAPILTGYSTLLPALSAVTGLSLGLPGWAIGGLTLGTALVQSPALRGPLIRGGQRLTPFIDDTVEFLTKSGDQVPPALVPFISAKIAGMSQVERDVNKVTNESQSNMKNFLNNPQKFKTPSIKKFDLNYDKSLQDLMKIASDPVEFENYLDEQLNDLGLVYPEVREPIKNKMKDTTGYLMEKLPRQVDSGNPLEDAIDPNDLAIQDFRDAAEVVNDPRSVFVDLKNESLNMTKVEALKRVYPRVYADMQGAFLEDIESAKSKLSYNQKLQLSLLFDVEGIPALNQQNLMQLQANYEGEENRASPPQGISRGLLNVAASAETQGQRGYGAS